MQCLMFIPDMHLTSNYGSCFHAFKQQKYENINKDKFLEIKINPHSHILNKFTQKWFSHYEYMLLNAFKDV